MLVVFILLMSLSLAEPFLDLLSWLPCYSLLKLGAVVGILLPNSASRKYVYDDRVGPFIEAADRAIRSIFSTLISTVMSHLSFIALGIIKHFLNNPDVVARLPSPTLATVEASLLSSLQVIRTENTQRLKHSLTSVLNRNAASSKSPLTATDAHPTSPLTAPLAPVLSSSQPLTGSSQGVTSVSPLSDPQQSSQCQPSSILTPSNTSKLNVNTRRGGSRSRKVVDLHEDNTTSTSEQPSGVNDACSGSSMLSIPEATNESLDEENTSISSGGMSVIDGAENSPMAEGGLRTVPVKLSALASRNRGKRLRMSVM